MGSEDEVEQSNGRPCRQTNGQFQGDMRTHLIHHPARDIRFQPCQSTRLSRTIQPTKRGRTCGDETFSVVWVLRRLYPFSGPCRYLRQQNSRLGSFIPARKQERRHASRQS